MPRRYSIADYLRIESDSAERHEYWDGQIVAMAGGTYGHSLIISNLIGEIRNALKGKPCRVLESSMRIRIPGRTRYFYPDSTIVCGKPEFDPEDPKQHSIINPRVVIEVLSPTTEGFDRGEKFSFNRAIESMQEYVLVSSETASIETFYRQSDGTWLFSAFSGDQAIAKLRAVEIDLPLAEVYTGVEFPPPKPEDAELQPK